MEKKDFIIGVDMDDTIENLMNAWVEYLNTRYGTTVKSDEIIEWEVAKFFPSIPPDKLYEPLYSEEFWKTVKPKKDAQTYLKKLYDEGYSIFIVTCSHYASVKVKVENCLLKYYPYIDWRQIITIRFKQMLTLDVLIDDYHKNLINGSYKGILIDNPYNRSFKEDNKQIYRAYTWDQVYNLVNQMYKEKELKDVK